MAFPEPVGIMHGPAIAESLKGAPRWKSVEMTERASANPDGDMAVLAYRAEGTCHGASPYAAYCSSTYVRRNGDWRMVQHQQTSIR